MELYSERFGLFGPQKMGKGRDMTKCSLGNERDRSSDEGPQHARVGRGGLAGIAGVVSSIFNEEIHHFLAQIADR